MTVKSDVSSNYLTLLHEEHGNKSTRYPVKILFTGNQRLGSIGRAIQCAVYSYGNQFTYKGDITQPIDKDQIDRTFDTLIMCHGASHLDWFEDAPLDKVKNIFDVNLFGTYNMAQAFVNATIDAPYRKRIIIIGSMAHRAVLNGSSAYCASKAGLAHLVRCMAWELAPKGFDVYIIHPSNTLNTPMSEETIEGLMRYRGLTLEEATAYWNDSMVRKRSLTKEEIAELVCVILTQKLSYLSGSQIELAGGQR